MVGIGLLLLVVCLVISQFICTTVGGDVLEGSISTTT